MSVTSTAGKLLNTRAAMIAVGIVVVVAVGYFAVKKLKDLAGEVVDDYNAGTAYSTKDSNALQSVIPTLGHVTDDLTGNVLSTFGSWLGGKVYDWTHEEYDPNK